MSATYDESKHNRAGDGKFATLDGGREAAGQVGDAFADESPSVEQMHAETAAVIEDNRDFLQPRTSPHDGSVRHETPEVLLGRLRDGSRVFAQVAITHRQRPVRTSDELEEVDESYGASVTYSIIEKGRREPSLIGRGFTEKECPGLKRVVPASVRRLEAQHLNDLRAGTERQMADFEQMRNDPAISRSDLMHHALDNIEPDRGYRYGSDWLYKPVEASDYRAALDALRERSAKKIR